LERCPDCGANLALVGRRHNCRPRLKAEPVDQNPRRLTKMPLTPKGNLVNRGRGRPRGPQPWKALGITKQAWYKRRKRAAAAPPERPSA
jgi:hypothetical protein